MTTVAAVKDFLIEVMSRHERMHYQDLVKRVSKSTPDIRDFFAGSTDSEKIRFFMKEMDGFDIDSDGVVSLSVRKIAMDEIAQKFYLTLKDRDPIYYTVLIEMMPFKDKLRCLSDAQKLEFFKSRSRLFIVNDDGYVSVPGKKFSIVKNNTNRHKVDVFRFFRRFLWIHGKMHYLHLIQRLSEAHCEVSEFFKSHDELSKYHFFTQHKEFNIDVAGFVSLSQDKTIIIDILKNALQKNGPKNYITLIDFVCKLETKCDTFFCDFSDLDKCNFIKSHDIFTMNNNGLVCVIESGQNSPNPAMPFEHKIRDNIQNKSEEYLFNFLKSPNETTNFSSINPFSFTSPIQKCFTPEPSKQIPAIPPPRQVFQPTNCSSPKLEINNLSSIQSPSKLDNGSGESKISSYSANESKGVIDSGHSSSNFQFQSFQPYNNPKYQFNYSTAVLFNNKCNQIITPKHSSEDDNCDINFKSSILKSEFQRIAAYFDPGLENKCINFFHDFLTRQNKATTMTELESSIYEADDDVQTYMQRHYVTKNFWLFFYLHLEHFKISDDKFISIHSNNENHNDTDLNCKSVHFFLIKLKMYSGGVSCRKLKQYLNDCSEEVRHHLVSKYDNNLYLFFEENSKYFKIDNCRQICITDY